MVARSTSRATDLPVLAFGVDPGASGAVALIGPGFGDGRVVDTKVPEEIEAAVDELVASALAVYGLAPGRVEPCVEAVYIEDVHSMPGEGHVGVFSFGQAKGVPTGWFASRGFRRGYVVPQTWQRLYFGVTLKGMGKPERKDAILKAARKRWPEASLGRAKDEAVAAALFIAQAGLDPAAW